jgi:hypothetical protein
LAPEIPNGVLRDALFAYGNVIRITDEYWPSKYKYRLESGIRLVEILLRKHIPSHMSLVGTRLLITYEGQPATCYGFNGMGHLYAECPTRRRQARRVVDRTPKTWAEMVTEGANVDAPMDMRSTVQVDPERSDPRCGAPDTQTPVRTDGQSRQTVQDAEHQDNGGGGTELVPAGQMGRDRVWGRRRRRKGRCTLTPLRREMHPGMTTMWWLN